MRAGRGLARRAPALQLVEPAGVRTSNVRNSRRTNSATRLRLGFLMRIVAITERSVCASEPRTMSRVGSSPSSSLSSSASGFFCVAAHGGVARVEHDDVARGVLRRGEGVRIRGFRGERRIVRERLFDAPTVNPLPLRLRRPTVVRRHLGRRDQDLLARRTEAVKPRIEAMDDRFAGGEVSRVLVGRILRKEIIRQTARLRLLLSGQRHLEPEQARVVRELDRDG